MSLPPVLVPDASWLRSRFEGARTATQASAHADLPVTASLLRPASVLIPIIEREPGLTVLFTRRTDHLQAHAGQISFPGGGAEASDESPVATALRETEEEIGLPAHHVEVLGRLAEHPTVTGYRVTPVVGLVRPPFELRLDKYEVAEIFEVPLAFLLDPGNHRRDRMVREGSVHEFDAVPYGPHYIWGATAAMLLQLHRFLTART
jgi:8-oxo-dGTP pyrophosphatase MutT (NUDIX family)